MKKAPEAFRTISEVADLLETPAHVLRFWESKFYQIRPVKRAGGRRYYRPDDVALINGIKTLLQDRGMTIRGAQRILQDEGIKAVAQLGLPLPQGGAMLRVVPADEDPVDADEALDPADDAPDLHPDVEMAVEIPPSAGYADAKAGGEETLPPPPAAEDQPQGARATMAPETAPDPTLVEDTAMSSDDLLTPLADPVPPAPAPAPDLLSAMLRPRAPVPEAPAAPEIPEMPERARLAKALRSLPRNPPAAQRDRLTVLARRIDALLERMSEASGAGRW